MPGHRPLFLPVSLAWILAFTVVPAPATADLIVELTTHETADGPATTDISTCTFFVKGVGLIEETGTVRIYLGEPPVEVGNATFDGEADLNGLFEMTAGPIDLGSNYVGLYAVVTQGEFPSLASAGFQVQCSRPLADPASCVLSSFLPPLGTPGHAGDQGWQRFKFGQAIPVMTNASCEPVYAPRLLVAWVGPDGLGPEQPAKTMSSAYTENLLRRNGNHWHYNLDTSYLAKGHWRIRIDVGDASEHVAWLDLR